MQISGSSVQIARATDMISSKIGIIKDFRRGHSQSSDPRVISYSAATCDSGVMTDAFQHFAGGAGLGWQDAFMATVGEAAERYGSSFYQLDKLVQGSARDLETRGLRIMRPEQFALFHQEQYSRKGFPFVPFDWDLPLYWDTARDLTTGDEVYCPAVFLYMPFRADEKLISEQISTGFAVHTDPKRALLSAAYEVVERDAFMISWMHQLPLRKFKLEGELGALVKGVVPDHLKVHLLDMTTDLGIPSVVGVMLGEQDFGKFIVVCAASRATFHEACRKTVVELCQSVPYYRNLLEKEPEKTDFTDVRTFKDHSIFYIRNPDLWHVFAPWLDVPATLAPPVEEAVSIDEQLQRLVAAFRKQGYPLLAKDKTTPDLANAGFQLARVVAPDLIHLNGSFGAYYFGGRRLYETPAKMGFGGPRTYADLSPYPHPFP